MWLFARSGIFGGAGLIYSLSGMIIAQTLIAVPLVIGITLAAVGSLDDEWDLQVRTLGISRAWRLWLLVREIRMGLLAAVIAALGGILSEVGASQMVGGNLDGKTRVLNDRHHDENQHGAMGTRCGIGRCLDRPDVIDRRRLDHRATKRTDAMTSGMTSDVTLSANTPRFAIAA